MVCKGRGDGIPIIPSTFLPIYPSHPQAVQNPRLSTGATYPRTGHRPTTKPLVALHGQPGSFSPLVSADGHQRPQGRMYLPPWTRCLLALYSVKGARRFHREASSAFQQRNISPSFLNGTFFSCQGDCTAHARPTLALTAVDLVAPRVERRPANTDYPSAYRGGAVLYDIAQTAFRAFHTPVNPLRIR